MDRPTVWTQTFKQTVAHTLTLIAAGTPLEDAVHQVVDRCYRGRAVKRPAARYQLRTAVRRALELANQPTKTMSPTLYRPLTAAEQECLGCPLPECSDGPGCPYHRRIARERSLGRRYNATRWTWLQERVRAHFAVRLDPYVIELSQRDRNSATSSVHSHVHLQPIRPDYELHSRSIDLHNGTARIEFHLCPVPPSQRRAEPLLPSPVPLPLPGRERAGVRVEGSGMRVHP